jgi:hypothetical protein
MRLSRCAVLFLNIVFLSVAHGAAPQAPILTRWGKEVTPENVWTEYPRPQMVRGQETWKNLNGLWDYIVTSRDAFELAANEGKILVPFPIEAPLSGVVRDVTAEEAIWYHRTFEVPKGWLSSSNSHRVLLHIEAADWETAVWINDKEIGTHRGGYDPFTFDITGALADSGRQELVVRVWDPQGTAFKSLGKQDNRAEQYQRCSGIWQTVWLERVPATSVEALKITPSADGSVKIEPSISGNRQRLSVRYEVLDGDRQVVSHENAGVDSVTLKVPRARLWSQEDPFLYDLNVTLLRDDEVVDRVKSYFGLRSIALADTPNGRQITLNGKRIFQMGPLDQNYWPGGGLTAPSDEAMAWEVDYIKRIGCNMVRLHIKQNPRRWYMHCDRLGLLVWQDFISAQKSKRFEKVSAEESEQWLGEQKRLMDTLYNHPSIIKWIVFNEGWGQHDVERILKWTMDRDPSRIVSIASGWQDLPQKSHIRDIHDYTFCASIPALGTEPQRAVVLGECGGFASAVPGHNWTGRSNQTGKPKNPMFGGFDPSVPRDNNRDRDIFRPTFTFGKAFEEQYGVFVENLRLLQNNGLTGAIYTQMTDMKLEENGYLSFDREASKMDVDKLRAIHMRLYDDPPIQRPIIPPSREKVQSWRYAEKLSKAAGWTQPDYDDSDWKAGKGPFGNASKYPAGTPWQASKLYLRKTFNLEDVPAGSSLRIYTYLVADGQMGWNYTRVYLNGQFIHDDVTRQSIGELRVADIRLRPEALKSLRQGRNTIAIEVQPGYSPKNNKVVNNIKEIAFDISLMEVIDR